jgi:polyferredoxin
MTSASGARLDLLRLPVVGSALRWRHFRTTVQLFLLVGALVIVLHGFFGPDIASNNLSTVLTWVHYRGLLIVALLAVGNVFCTGCPFVLVRDWGRRFFHPALRPPSWLRGKWGAAALFAAALFTYELFDLWALPVATAWLVLGYFGAALVVDLVFSGATFCKHLCPVGQFSFIASTVSPLEVQVRDRDVCGSCRTADCVTGRRLDAAAADSRRPNRVHAPVVQRGCELGLYLPSKVGNLDCTFCLDCVQACPHDNVAIAARTPALELTDGSLRSGIGRLAARPDLVLLVVFFVFGALLNAFAMTAPVHRLELAMARAFGADSQAVTLAVLFVVGLGLLPLSLLTTAAYATRQPTARDGWSVRALVMRFAYSVVPLGCGIWLAHYGFHLATGLLVVVPIAQNAAADLFGTAVLGGPWWRLSGLRPGSILPLQIGAVLLGTAGSMGVAYVIATEAYPRRPLRASLPWLLVIAGLGAAAMWIFAQPMEMRGTGGIG